MNTSLRWIRSELCFRGEAVAATEWFNNVAQDETQSFAPMFNSLLLLAE